MAPPTGRPIKQHVWHDGRGWVHHDTGVDFDAVSHAQQVRAAKLECMHRLYWERGGRARRLARYTKKRKPKPIQLTLCDPVHATTANSPPVPEHTPCAATGHA